MAVPKLPQGCPLFRNRFIDALEKRLHPVGSLRRKEFAFAMRVNGKTVDRWMSGKTSPSAEMTAEAVRFFWLHGDRGFAEEIFWIRIEPPTHATPSHAPVMAALAAYEAAKAAETVAA